MKLDLYGDVAFHCRCCEVGCCSLFEVAVTPEERAALEKLALPELERPELCFKPGAGKDFILGKDPATGRCVFSNGAHCLIQQKYGYAAKPLSCRVFPLHIQQWRDGRVSVEYRFICPAVGGSGRKIGEQKPEITVLAREMALRRGDDDAVYAENNPVKLEIVRMVHEGFCRILHNQDDPWALRLYTAARVLDFHGQRAMRGAIAAADETFARDAAEFAAKAREVLVGELAAGEVDALTRTNFRNILCGYLRDDAGEKNPGLMYRLARTMQQLRIVSGKGLLTELNLRAPEVPGDGFPLRKERFSLNRDGRAMFERFFFAKLDSFHFCGGMVHNMTYEEGMRHLLLAAPMAYSLAAGYARAANRREIGESEMLEAVRLLDFAFARSPFFRLKAAKRWTRQQLKPKNYAGLLRESWCGESAR